MSENDFDVAVIGTSLVESIVAAALSKAGLKVLHIDEVAEYGGRDASLSAIDLHHLILSPPSHMTNISIPTPLSQEVLRESRQYAISLMPSIAPSTGSFINILVNSNVARYVPFKLLDSVGLYDQDEDGNGRVKAVPGSKEDVFKNKDLGLLQKRKLMKFLLNASNYEESDVENEQLRRPFLEYLKGKEVGLDRQIAEAIAYALALSTDPEESASRALSRLKKYIRSTGRHGNSPFIVGHFGGAGELAQGFCRACAVSGGTYILGRPYTFKRDVITPPQFTDGVTELTAKNGSQSLNQGNGYPFSFTIDGIDDVLRSKLVVSVEDKIPSEIKPKLSSGQATTSKCLARCIAILDGPVRFFEKKELAASVDTQAPMEESVPEGTEEEVENPTYDDIEANPDVEIDTAVLIFPPNSLQSLEGTDHTVEGGVVTAFISGPSSMACPDGKRVVYLYAEIADGREAEKALSPYLAAIRSLHQTEPNEALLEMFYSEPLPAPIAYCNRTTLGAPSVNSDDTDSGGGVFIVRQPTYHLAEFGDEVAKESERAFWEVITKLGLDGRGERKAEKEGVSALEKSGDGVDDADEKIVSMWPPFQPDENNDG